MPFINFSRKKNRIITGYVLCAKMITNYKFMSKICHSLFFANLLAHVLSFFNFNIDNICIILFFLTIAANIPCIWIIPKNSEMAREWAQSMPKRTKIIMFMLGIYGVAILPILDSFTLIHLSEKKYEIMTVVLLLCSLMGYSAYKFKTSIETT